MSLKQVLGIALLVCGGAIYIGLNYAITVTQHPTLLMLLFGIAPLAALGLVSAWNAKSRALALGLYLVALTAALFNLELLRVHTAWLYFLQHAGAMTLLGITFGRTLHQGHANALCSRISTFIMRCEADPAYQRYTWQVTLAWTVYFTLSAVLSLLLFFFASIEVWSFFANLLTPVLVGVMFAGEYLIRLRTMPDRLHFSIAQTIRAYRNSP